MTSLNLLALLWTLLWPCSITLVIPMWHDSTLAPILFWSPPKISRMAMKSATPTLFCFRYGVTVSGILGSIWFISFQDVPKLDRQKHLQKHFRFECRCVACRGRSECTCFHPVSTHNLCSTWWNRELANVQWFEENQNQIRSDHGRGGGD